MATVFIPAPLRTLTGGVECVEISASTVREIIDALDEQFPGIKARLCQGEELSPSLQVAIDSVMTSQGMRAKVGPDSEVHFLPALGGG